MTDHKIPTLLSHQFANYIIKYHKREKVEKLFTIKDLAAKKKYKIMKNSI
jgi:hypothetical protein